MVGKNLEVTCVQNRNSLTNTEIERLESSSKFTQAFTAGGQHKSAKSHGAEHFPLDHAAFFCVDA